MEKPAFIVTVDTEGDDLWSRPTEIETKNAQFVARFQALCEKYGFKPTWLTNYEMAMTPSFVDFGKQVLRDNIGEIGMHLHAWNSPPIRPLTSNDYEYQPFLTEYPADVMEEKVSFMTKLLQDKFETKITSHRAGRWGFDSTYAKILVKYGYLVDCSVCPHINWKGTLGAPTGNGGPDYRNFPCEPYLLDLDSIYQAGKSTLLEVPASVIPSPLYAAAPWAYTIRGIRRFAWRHSNRHFWLYPGESNSADMMKVVEDAISKGRSHLEMVIHSSELMPGGRPQLSAEGVEAMYGELKGYLP